MEPIRRSIVKSFCGKYLRGQLAVRAGSAGLTSANTPGTQISGSGLRRIHDLPRLGYLYLKRIFMHLTCGFVCVPLLVMAYIAYGNTPALGVALESHDEGCRVTRVIPQSSAEQAGLEAGDVVISLDEQATRRPRDLMAALAKCKVGSQVRIEIIRHDRRMTLNVTLNRRRR
jgi:hypothetical protein